MATSRITNDHDITEQFVSYIHVFSCSSIPNADASYHSRYVHHSHSITDDIESPCSSESDFVAACPCHVPHPFHAAVIALLKDLQIPHQQPRTREHEQTELQTQRWPRPRLLRRHGTQLRLRTEHKLLLPAEPRNLPHDIVMLRFVLGLALTHPLGRLGRVEWCRDPHDHVRGEKLGPIVRPDGNTVLDLALTDLVHDRVHLERQVHVLRGPVPHQLELAVGRDEGDHPLAIELAQLHALVELAILETDAARGRFRRLRALAVAGREGEAVRVEQEAVVEAELAVRHPGQVGPHDDLAGYVGPEHCAGGGHEQVHILDDVHEGFVLPVAEIRFAPGDGACCLHGDAGGILRYLQVGLDTFSRNVHLERINLRVLRVSEVYYFCESKIVSQLLPLEYGFAPGSFFHS